MLTASTSGLRLPQLGFDLPYLVEEWKAMLNPSTMVKDVWAGMTVALVALPLNLALAVNIRAGAQTLPSAIVRSLVLTVLIFLLAKYAQQILLCALAAILVLARLRLIEWEAVRQIWNASRREGYVVLATTLACVLIVLTAGVITGLVFTCGPFIRQMSEVPLVPAAGGGGAGTLTQDVPHCELVRTCLVDAALFFGASERFIENILLTENVKVIIMLGADGLPEQDKQQAESNVTSE